MDTYGRDWKGKGINSPKAYWSNDPKPGVHLIGLDTSQSDLTVGAISDAQLDWLKRDLDGNKGKFTIVI
ncbi:metallophosphoesterase, partial [Acinetobacter baumannii]